MPSMMLVAFVITSDFHMKYNDNYNNKIEKDKSISLDLMMVHMKVCNKRYLFMCLKSLYSIKKI